SPGDVLMIGFQVKGPSGHVNDLPTQFLASHAHPSFPSHAWAFYEHDSAGPAITKGWQATGGPDINIWISMTVQSLPESSVVAVHPGWNLFSTPLQQAELCDPELLASASSNAFGYDGSQYVIAHGFRGGKGYWLKFSNPDSFLIAGTAFDSAEVIAGW